MTNATRDRRLVLVLLAAVAGIVGVVVVAVLIVAFFVFRGDSGYNDPDKLATFLALTPGVSGVVCVAGSQERTFDCSVTFADVPVTDPAFEDFPAHHGTEMHTFRVSADGKTMVAIS